MPAAASRDQRSRLSALHLSLLLCTPYSAAKLSLRLELHDCTLQLRHSRQYSFSLSRPVRRSL